MKGNKKNVQPQAPVSGPVVPSVQAPTAQAPAAQAQAAQGPPATAAVPAPTPTREVVLAATVQATLPPTTNEPTTPAAKPVIVYRQRVHSKDSVRTMTPANLDKC